MDKFIWGPQFTNGCVCVPHSVSVIFNLKAKENQDSLFETTHIVICSTDLLVLLVEH